MSRHVYFNCHVCTIQTLKNNGKGCNPKLESGLLWKRSHFGGGVENHILISKRARVSLSRSQTYSTISPMLLLYQWYKRSALRRHLRVKKLPLPASHVSEVIGFSIVVS